jgi:hypothetical protein
VTPAVSSIPVSLDQVACSRASASADHSALLAAEQCAADPARDATDDSSSPSAMMTCSMPPLHAEAGAYECAEH